MGAWFAVGDGARDPARSKRRLLVATGIAVLLALAFLWGSMHTTRLAGYTENVQQLRGAYSENMQMWAYFQFLLFGIFGAMAVVALLNVRSSASNSAAVLMGLVAAFASVVASFGLLAMIGAVAGHHVYQALGVAFPLGVAVVSIAIYWWIVRSTGVGMAGSLLGGVIALTLVPSFYVGALLFCGLFTPHIRCM